MAGISSLAHAHAAEGRTLGTQSLQRAMTILRTLAQQSPVGVGLTQVAARTGLNPATAHRLLACLVEEGMVAREPAGRKLYKLGPFALGLGPDGSRHHFAWLVDLARAGMEALAAATGCTVHLVVRVGHNGMIIDRVDGGAISHPAIGKVGNVGFLGYGCGSVVLLAALPPAAAEELLWENNWMCSFFSLDPETIRAVVEETRAKGYCFSDSIFAKGVSGLAMCVPAGLELPSISLSLISDNGGVSDAKLPALLPLLRDAVTALAERIAARTISLPG